MSAYDIKENATGRITGHLKGTLAAGDIPTGYTAIAGAHDTKAYYYVGTTPTAKTALTATWNYITAASGTEFILSTLPSEDCICRVLNDAGQEVDRVTVTDGSLELTINYAATLHVVVDCPSKLLKVYELTIT